MASQHGSSGFISPIFNQNFPANNFNVNPSMDRPPRPQFQVPHNPASGSLQSPERFIHGFQNRPQFSNFPGDCSFLSRPPPLPPSSTVHPPPPTNNSFPRPLNSAPRPSFPSQPPAASHPTFSARPPLPPHLPPPSPVPSHPPPPLPQPTFSSQQSFPPHQPPLHNQFSSMPHPPQHNQLPNMSHPPQCNQPPNMSHPPQHNQPPNISHMPQHNQAPSMPHRPQNNQALSMPHPPQHNQLPNMSHPPQHNQLPNMSHPSQHNQLPNMSHPSQHNQLPNMPCPPQHNQLPNVSCPPQYNKPPNIAHPPQQNPFPSISQSAHQVFRLNSPNLSSPPATRIQFDHSFHRPYRPWNKMSGFSGPRTPFTNRSPNVVKSHQFKDTSQEGNKKKKQKSREFRKLKDDSTEKPYSCDTCDRAFATESELSDHLSQHIKCDYENCAFEAHPKIVLLHKKMQHETGYAECISKLKDDAEVKKWREERRKRFPTAENIRKRKAEEAEKIARGEVLETKEFGKFKRSREENTDLAHSSRKRMRGRNRRPRRHMREKYPNFQQIKVNSESDSDSDSHISLNMFSGLSSLANSAEGVCQPDEITEINSSGQNLTNLDKNHSNVSHSENNSVDKKAESPVILNVEKSSGYNLVKQPLSINFTNQSFRKSIGNVSNIDESVLEIPEDEVEKPQKELIAIDDSDDEGPEVIAITKCQEEMSAVGKEKESRSDGNISVKGFDVNQEKSSKENEKTESNVNDATNISGINCENANKGNQSRRQKGRRDCNFTAPKQVRKSTLLEKLLADDIRHERNVILQCIRHIVNNNFFGLGVKKS